MYKRLPKTPLRQLKLRKINKQNKIRKQQIKLSVAFLIFTVDFFSELV